MCINYKFFGVISTSSNHHKVEVFIFSYFFSPIYLFSISFFIFLFKIKMDPHYLDVENLNFGIDECEEFNPFEYEENLTPLVTLNPSLLLIPNM